MSGSALSFLHNPALAMGVMTFQNNRLDTYESLIEALENRDTSTNRIQKIFETWAARDKKRMESRHLVYTAVATRLARGGATVAQALKPFVSDDEFLIISSAQSNGDLPKALRLVVRNIIATNTMKDKAGEELRQPALGVLLLLGLSYGYGRGLWPDFIRAMPLKYWPAWTIPCIDFQSWFATYWYSVFVVVLLVAVYYWTRDRWTGRSRDWADKLPPWSIHKGRKAANFLGITSALLQSGKPVRQAMVEIRDLSEPYMRWQVTRMIAKYDVSGENAISSLKTGLFNPLILDRIEDAQAGRDFSKALAHVGDGALTIVMRVVNKQATASAMLLMTLVGIGFFYFVAVTVIGIQEATDAFMKFNGGGVPM